VAHADADAVLATEWQKWHIEFSDLMSQGVNIAAVKKMYIGIGNRDNPQPGGTGRIYIDDIRLTQQMLQTGWILEGQDYLRLWWDSQSTVWIKTYRS